MSWDERPDIDKVKKDGTKILKPDETIQKKVGNIDFDKAITEEMLEEAQGAVDEKADEFEKILRRRLDIVQSLYLKMKQDMTQKDELIEKIQESVLDIKSNAGMFQFELASMLAWALYNTFETMKTEFNKEKDEIALKLIRALQLIFLRKIKGEGGALGKEIIDELSDYLEALKKQS